MYAARSQVLTLTKYATTWYLKEDSDLGYSKPHVGNKKEQVVTWERALALKYYD